MFFVLDGYQLAEEILRVIFGIRLVDIIEKLTYIVLITGTGTLEGKAGFRNSGFR